MLRYFLITALFISACKPSAYGLQFTIGGEIGISAPFLKSLPKSALPNGYLTGADGFISPSGLVGFKYKDTGLLVRGSSPFAPLDQDDVKEPFNAASLDIASVIFEQDFIPNRKLKVGIIGGYEYTNFEAYATDIPQQNYKYVKTEALVGIKSLMTSHWFLPKDWGLEFSYEYTNFSQPLHKITFQYQREEDDKLRAFISFKIYSQKDIYLMFSITVGAQGYFNIL